MSRSNRSSPEPVASDGQITSDTSQQQAPLVGGVGQEFVQSVLSTNDPASAIREIQRRGALQSPTAKPLLGLLDQLGCTRLESHRTALVEARSALLGRVPRLPPEALLALLEASFAFVGIPELRAVPLAVLDRLQPVPATFLKQLATDPDLFHELPRGVQRQVWELDRKLLQQHALPLVAAYAYETATIMRALDMDECLPPQVQVDAKGRPLPAKPPRRFLRTGSAALQKLVGMVGRSRQVYKGVVELCVLRFRDSEGLYVGMREAAYCSLRSQLLMALHDAGQSELCAKEPSHKLAWTLDACLKDRTLDERRLRELQNFFALYDNPTTGASRGGGGHGKRKRAAQAAAATASGDDAESAGVPGASASRLDEPGRVIGDAGMVLRDPSTLHLLAHQIVRRLEGGVEAAALPQDDAELAFLTRLMQLAAGCRSMLRDRKPAFPPPSQELVHTFYPILANIMLEAQLRDSDDEAEAAEAEPVADEALVGLLARNETVRRVSQVYCLERLAFNDLPTARALLAAMVQALQKLSDKSLPEWAPFAFSLAQRLSVMLGAGRVAPGTPLWDAALDHILLRALDTEVEVHEEVLRLLLAAAPKMSLQQLAAYLQTAIQNSRKSRRRFKRRKQEAEAFEPLSGYNSGGYSSGGRLSGYTSGSGFANGSGWSSAGTVSEGPAGGAAKGSDGVRHIYKLFKEQIPGITEATAPALFAYLNAL